MRHKSIRAIATAAMLASLGFAAQNANALPVTNPAVITLNGASVETYDSSASNSANTVNYKFNLGTDHILSSLSFSGIVVSTDTAGNSYDAYNWASFVRIELYNSNGDSISDNFGNVSPFEDATYNATGDVSFADLTVDLSNSGFSVGNDGLLYVKFYEDGNNPTQYLGGSGGLGATIDSGTVTITAVPEPSNIALMMLGLAGMGLVARRRSKN